MNNEKINYSLLAIIGVGLLVTLFVASYLVPRVLVTMTKAAPATRVSAKDSYVLGEKILARADGKDKNVVNVFVMDSSGKGVGGKTVQLEGVDNIVAVNDVSDKDGKTSFAVTSIVEGQFVLSAVVDGVQLPREVKVTFRN